jgi:hypothetical protein
MADLDDVVDKLSDIEQAIAAKKDQDIFGPLLGIWLFLWVVVFSPTSTNITLNKLWYSASTSASWDDIHVEPQPTDCDWGHAPIGNKACSYTKQVLEEICGSSQGKPTYSNDGGKNWAFTADGGACVPSTYVSWTKKEIQ